MGHEFLEIREGVDDKGQAGKAQEDDAESLQLAAEQVAVDQHKDTPAARGTVGGER